MKRPCKGMTLLELILRIVIVGVLAGILVPPFVHSEKQGPKVRTRHRLMRPETCMNLYLAEHGAWPDVVTWRSQLAPYVSQPGWEYLTNDAWKREFI